MNTNRIKIELKNYIEDRVDLYEEYHNKYFLKKKIKELLPDKTDDFIYQAIEYANKRIKFSNKKKDYINSLLEKIIENK